MLSTQGQNMNMLVKFESKSSRVKGVAFHPKFPWLLTSLHNGCIQLWDYRMGSLLERFEEHDGPVRSVDFHRTQPLFVSGGDDYKVKVWNYRTRKCLFTLSGHLDYVRTVAFHHEYPWILTCSDDQTIRIWNWQSRNCIALVSGHSHYVMSAQFHPTEDLIVSASLDQTVRVWDISGLRRKNAAPQSTSFEEQLERASAQQAADLFGTTDVVVKYVLEGHDRGVNWASFHPSMPLIISAADDRTVKLWRMSATKAWEVDTCRGHFNNVSAAIFHPRLDVMLSAGEDKTIRVWDTNKRTGIQNFRRENDRFWVIAAHPELNLLATGHDNGAMIFKLERERPAYAADKDQLYFIDRSSKLMTYNFATGDVNDAYLTCKKTGPAWEHPRTLSFNPADRSALIVASETFSLGQLPSTKQTVDMSAFGKSGPALSAVFVTRNRFAVLDKSKQTIELRDMNNAVTKTIKTPAATNEIFYGGPGNILLSTNNDIVLWDVQRGKVAELPCPRVKYISWSNDGQHVALISKHNILIATKALVKVCNIHETIRLKSCVWDDSGVLIYNHLNHLKYSLVNGDKGIIKTLDDTIYLTKVKGRQVFCLDRRAQPQTIDIDPTEYRFKLALVKKNYSEMFSIIQNSNLVGQGIISYVQAKGFPEIALQFVQDPATRFELAVEYGDLDIALQEAKTLDKLDVWKQLGIESLRQGNAAIAELAHQKLKSFEKLSLLYLVTGEKQKLQKMARIAASRGDFTAQFQNSLYLGDAAARVETFRQAGMYSLAYLTAKSHGLDTEDILAEAGVTEEQITMPTSQGQPLAPLEPVARDEATAKQAWPLKPLGDSNLETLLTRSGSPSGTREDGEDFFSGDADASRASKGIEGDDQDGDDGWDMAEVDGDDGADDADADAFHDDDVFGEAQEPATSELERWQQSSLAVNHIAAGSLETAMALLNRQAGIVDFAPLKDHFSQIIVRSQAYMPANINLPAMPVNVRNNVYAADEESDHLTSSAPAARDVTELEDSLVAEGFRLFRSNKLAEAVEAFRSALYASLFLSVESQEEVRRVDELVETCSRYMRALSIELRRREEFPSSAEVPTDDEAGRRNLELAAHFACSPMQPAHRALALQNAMNVAVKAKNLLTAAEFAQRLLSVSGGSGKAGDAAKRIISQSERTGSNKVAFEFDFDGAERGAVELDAHTFHPITGSAARSSCPLCKARYDADAVNSPRGKACGICKIGGVGLPAAGRRVIERR
ncbi:hypothetical protein PYCC9005_003794 [Savitreella phatthalungensis]